MRTRNVFIDTSIFRQLQYQIGSKTFTALADLVRERRAHVCTTALTIHELEQRINAECHAASTDRGTFRKRHDFLYRHLTNRPTSLDDNAEQTLAITITSKIAAYLEIVEAEQLPLTDANLQTIVDAFMRRKPPFARAKKQTEFVDAIVLSTLTGWCEENGEHVYVVCKDPDLIDYCTDSAFLHHLPSLETFLDLVQRHDGEDFPRLVLATFEAHKGTLANDILERFREHEFSVVDVDDDETEVTSASIKAWGDPQVLSVNVEASTIAVNVTIDYTADITYEDPSSGIWDREDQVMLFTEETTETVERTQEVAVEILLEYDAWPAETSDLSIESINNGQPFRLWLEHPSDLK